MCIIIKWCGENVLWRLAFIRSHLTVCLLCLNNRLSATNSMQCEKNSVSFYSNIWFEAWKELCEKFKWLSIGIIWNCMCVNKFIIYVYQMRINVIKWLIHIECPTHIKHSHLSSVVYDIKFYMEFVSVATKAVVEAIKHWLHWIHATTTKRDEERFPHMGMEWNG